MRRTPLLLASCLAFLAACDRAPTSPVPEAQPLAAVWSGGPDKVVTVMTRNLYLGASLDRVTSATTPVGIAVAVAQTWAIAQASNPPERMRRIADEIVAADPELVGLQEVSLWRTQSPSDQFTPRQSAAQDTVYDFLALLLDALAARGAAYEVVAISENADVEAPSAFGIDVRLTDRDVILAKRKLHTSNPQSGLYDERMIYRLLNGAVTLPSPRGWTSVDVKIRGESFRFFNTHLEVDGLAAIQQAQAGEVIALLGRTTLPVIAVGDFNSNAEGGPAARTLTYGLLLGAGFMDTWPQVNEDEGLTCCHREDLRNETVAFYSRIDLVLTRGLPGAIAAWVVGEELDDRTLGTPRLWPSDHAGVVAVVRLK